MEEHRNHSVLNLLLAPYNWISQSPSWGTSIFESVWVGICECILCIYEALCVHGAWEKFILRTDPSPVESKDERMIEQRTWVGLHCSVAISKVTMCVCGFVFFPLWLGDGHSDWSVPETERVWGWRTQGGACARGRNSCSQHAQQGKDEPGSWDSST